uniref:Uncharacterized protein n=1 Tax=viral metagenome TaxID=1070528 RepID=A0A6C0DHF2_9ZZZZ
MGQTGSKKINYVEDEGGYFRQPLKTMPKWRDSLNNQIFTGSVANFIGPEAEKREQMEKLCTETIQRITQLQNDLYNFKDKYRTDVLDKIIQIEGEPNFQSQGTLVTYKYEGNPNVISKTSPFISDYKQLFTERESIRSNVKELANYNNINKNNKLKCFGELQNADAKLWPIDRELNIIDKQLAKIGRDIQYLSLSNGGSRKRSLKKRKHSKCKRTRRR